MDLELAVDFSACHSGMRKEREGFAIALSPVL